ncbi:hypothetical protein CK203_012054 [Vitis vinifera]|uniref:Retrotransposon Copia-like N-terminal domain-containing protein n=1 Tax=Vitis vinifera TaxID=29760 RepID=A0A438K0S5_VITVI|nr:hypothetical protein CK203_012054 [Vitis vinifera]
MVKTAMTGTRRVDGSDVASGTSQPISTIVPTWSRLVLMVVRGKGKLDYLDGTIKKPSTDDPSYPSWEAQNSMVMAWLIHSMEDNIADTYILFPTAKRIWNAVTLAYSDLENSSQMFELRNKARNLRQGEHDVTQLH